MEELCEVCQQPRGKKKKRFCSVECKYKADYQNLSRPKKIVSCVTCNIDFETSKFSGFKKCSNCLAATTHQHVCGVCQKPYEYIRKKKYCSIMCQEVNKLKIAELRRNDPIHARSKLFGTLGEAAVMKDLITKDFVVFKEFGDRSRIDLIAEKNGALSRIQVKAKHLNRGMFALEKGKSGPGYSYIYRKEDIDIFAVYVFEIDKVFYIPIETFNEQSSLTLRVTPSLNNNQKNIHLADDFKNFPE